MEALVAVRKVCSMREDLFRRWLNFLEAALNDRNETVRLRRAARLHHMMPPLPAVGPMRFGFVPAGNHCVYRELHPHWL